MRSRRIRRDYGAAGGFNSLIALWGFIGEDTFLTKGGDLGIVYRAAGVDFECLDHTAGREVTDCFGTALRGLDESYRVYQYVCQRRMAPITSATCRLSDVDEVVHRRAAFSMCAETSLSSSTSTWSFPNNSGRIARDAVSGRTRFALLTLSHLLNRQQCPLALLLADGFPRVRFREDHGLAPARVPVQ
jgi:hypothetical protein